MFLANILVPFACTEGKLNANPSVLCSTYDSTYTAMLVACVFVIPMYVVIPLVFLVRNIYGGCRHACSLTIWEPFTTEERLQSLESQMDRTLFTGDTDALNTEINSLKPLLGLIMMTYSIVKIKSMCRVMGRKI